MGHTPGPWAIQRDGLGVYYANPAIEAGEDIDDPRHDSIVARCTGFGAFSGIGEAEQEANAYLIAKAPTMLALLRDASETIDSYLVGKIPPEHRIAELSRVLSAMYALLATLPEPMVAPSKSNQKVGRNKPN